MFEIDNLFIRLREEFSKKDSTKEESINIINSIYHEYVEYKKIETSINFIQKCHSDFGFMGSPEYYEHKKIVDDYNNKKQLLDTEKMEFEKYLELKKRYENYLK